MLGKLFNCYIKTVEIIFPLGFFVGTYNKKNINNLYDKKYYNYITNCVYSCLLFSLYPITIPYMIYKIKIENK